MVGGGIGGPVAVPCADVPCWNPVGWVVAGCFVFGAVVGGCGGTMLQYEFDAARGRAVAKEDHLDEREQRLSIK